MTKVLLIEDHPEYREVIELTLQKEADLELVGQYGTAERALDELQNAGPNQAPDIILLDLHLPGMSGLEAIEWIFKYQPKVKIIVLTQSNQEADIFKAIQLGALGYLLKSSSIQTITNGLREVMKGGAVIDTNMAGYLMKKIKATTSSNSPLEKKLSERETEILSLLAEGFSKKEIANKLNIRASTVVTHVTHIYEKLQVPNAPAAVSKAYRRGLL